MGETYDLVIVGCGSAGLTAAGFAIQSGKEDTTIATRWGS